MRNSDKKESTRPIVGRVSLLAGKGIKSRKNKGATTQVFIKDEDTHFLRLTSELVDLRSGYADWTLSQEHEKSMIYVSFI